MGDDEVELVALKSSLFEEQSSSNMSGEFISTDMPGKGVIKLSECTMGRLKIKEGGTVKLSFGRRTIEAVVAVDYIYSENIVRVRGNDLKSLGARPGKKLRISLELPATKKQPSAKSVKKKSASKSVKKKRKRKKNSEKQQTL